MKTCSTITNTNTPSLCTVLKPLLVGLVALLGFEGYLLLLQVTYRGLPLEPILLSEWQGLAILMACTVMMEIGLIEQYKRQELKLTALKLALLTLLNGFIGSYLGLILLPVTLKAVYVSETVLGSPLSVLTFSIGAILCGQMLMLTWHYMKRFEKHYRSFETHDEK